MSKDFFRKYDMQVFPSQRKFRRIPRVPAASWWDRNTAELDSYHVTVEEVDCVDITMPKDRLEELENMIAWYEEREHKIKHNEDLVRMLRADERVRVENPIVQNAYMKYLNLLELCRK